MWYVYGMLGKEVGQLRLQSINKDKGVIEVIKKGKKLMGYSSKERASM